MTTGRKRKKKVEAAESTGKTKKTVKIAAYHVRPEEIELYPPDFYVNPKRIEPPHDVKDSAHLRSIVASFRKHGGWCGRPLLVESVGRAGWLSWTGSNRIKAAWIVGEKIVPEIPVVLIDKRAYVHVHGRPKRSYLSETIEDEERLGRLIECGDERAARLMAREVGLDLDATERAIRQTKRKTGGPSRVGSPDHPNPVP